MSGEFTFVPTPPFSLRMDLQLDLFPKVTPPENKYRLFVGIFPDAAAVESIHGLQIALRDQLGLRGKFRPREILHTTLHHIDDYPEVPHGVAKLAGEACAAATANQSPVEVAYDQVKSFRGRPGNQPFVLVAPDGNTGLMDLHRRLITELTRRGLAKPADFKFVPHVTLLYDRLNVPEQPIERVAWTAREIVLVLSYIGETRYERIQSWGL